MGQIDVHRRVVLGGIDARCNDCTDPTIVRRQDRDCVACTNPAEVGVNVITAGWTPMTYSPRAAPALQIEVFSHHARRALRLSPGRARRRAACAQRLIAGAQQLSAAALRNASCGRRAGAPPRRSARVLEGDRERSARPQRGDFAPAVRREAIDHVGEQYRQGALAVAPREVAERPIVGSTSFDCTAPARRAPAAAQPAALRTTKWCTPSANAITRRCRRLDRV